MCLDWIDKQHDKLQEKLAWKVVRKLPEPEQYEPELMRFNHLRWTFDGVQDAGPEATIRTEDGVGLYRVGFHAFATRKAARAWKNLEEGDTKNLALMRIKIWVRTEGLQLVSHDYGHAKVYVGPRMILLREVR